MSVGHWTAQHKQMSITSQLQQLFDFSNAWNCLPPSVDYATLATFRRSIDGIDFTSSLKL